MGGQAFDEERLNGGFKFKPEDLVIVGLDEPYADAGPEHPLWDPRAQATVQQETVDSIIAQGVLQPIRVVKDQDGNALVVMGRGRVKAARVANTQLKGTGRTVTVPAIMMAKGTSDFDQSLAKIAENTHRRDDTALALADKAAAALRTGDDSPAARKALAVALGMTPRRLEDLLRLREADPTLVKAAKNGTPVEVVVAIAKMPREDQAPALAKAQAEGFSAERAREHVRTKAAAKAVSNGETGKDGPRFPPPSKATVRRVLGDKEGKAILRDEAGDRVARWVIGDLAPTQIKGLVSVITGGT